ncbi:MAG: hypothetical protein LAP87_06015 [Acidobacteriia bacterium]|nr:hypothetical protein [Terriglobia bacterium]
MTPYSRSAAFIAPRALSVAFIAFVSLFALDVFSEGFGFWQTLTHLAVHLIPTFFMVAALVLAWRREWVGTALFTAFGILFLIVVRAPWWGKAIFAAPCFLVGWLFLLNWRHRKAP